jgi:hypothetical protein
VRNLAAVELGLREALFKDARGLLEKLYSQPGLCVPGDASRPGEKCHVDRSKEVLTLFGRVALRRNYYFDPQTGQGRVPLDTALGLVNSFSPAVVRLSDRAAAREGCEAASQDLRALAGLAIEPRQVQRLVGLSAPGANRRGPVSGTLRFPGTVRRELPAAGVFFTVFCLILEPGELVGQAHELFGQCLEAPVVGHVLLHLLGLVSGDALGELLAVEVALEDVIGAALAGGEALGRAEELPAQRAAAEAVDGLHLLEDEVPLLADGVDV